MNSAARAVAQPAGPVFDEDEILTHDQVTQSNIGWELEPERWSTACRRRERLDAQSEHLADLLEQAGVQARLESSVVAISAVTGIVKPLNGFRPIRFIPNVAARDRRPMLNGLRFWIDEECTRPDHLRYGVITASERVPAFGPLRDVLQKMHRDISRWASEAYAVYGIRVQFRGTENTRQTAAARGMSDYDPKTMIYHPHANILMQPMRLLPKEGPGSWAEFLSWTWREFGAHWKDNGIVQDPAEIVKYVFKPDELNDMSPEEAKWLHEQLYRLNLCQPMGDFREWYSELQDRKCKVVRVRAGQGSRLVIVQKSRKLDHSKSDEQGDDPEDRPEDSPEDSPKDSPKDSPGDDPAPENLFIGSTLPQWQHTPWAEPSLLVMNYNPRTFSRAAQERLAEIRFEQMAAREIWDKAGAPEPATALALAQEWRQAGGQTNVVNLASLQAKTREAKERAVKACSGSPAKPVPYRVHTCSLTVPTGRSGNCPEDPDPPPEKVPLIHLKEGESIATAVEKALGIEKSDADARGAPVIDIWA